MKEFTYNIYVPSMAKYYRYRTINNAQHLALAKFIQNDDHEQILQTCKHVIETCCAEDIKYEQLTCIDMFVILLNIRIMSVSDGFEIQTKVKHEKEETTKDIRVDLYEILNDVTNHKMNHPRSIDTGNGYHMKFGLPKNILNDSIEHLYLDVLEEIRIQDDYYDLVNLSREEKTQIIEMLPGNALTKIIQYIREMDNQYRIPLLRKTKYIVPDDVSSLQLKIYDNSLFEFTKLMYNCNLQEQYYIRYIMVKHMGFSLHDTDYITPIDTQTYINLYRKELDEERKANEKQHQPNKNEMSLPDPGFVQ